MAEMPEDQLILLQTRGADYAHHITIAPPDVSTVCCLCMVLRTSIYCFELRVDESILVNKKGKFKRIFGVNSYGHSYIIQMSKFLNFVISNLLHCLSMGLKAYSVLLNKIFQYM